MSDERDQPTHYLLGQIPRGLRRRKIANTIAHRRGGRNRGQRQVWTLVLPIMKIVWPEFRPNKVRMKIESILTVFKLKT